MILLTDDDRRAVSMLTAELGGRFDIILLSQISAMLDASLALYDDYARQGHTYFVKLAASSKACI